MKIGGPKFHEPGFPSFSIIFPCQVFPSSHLAEVFQHLLPLLRVAEPQPMIELGLQALGPATEASLARIEKPVPGMEEVGKYGKKNEKLWMET